MNSSDSKVEQDNNTVTRGRGRPKGSLDKNPRKRRKINEIKERNKLNKYLVKYNGKMYECNTYDEICDITKLSRMQVQRILHNTNKNTQPKRIKHLEGVEINKLSHDVLNLNLN